MRPLAIAGLLLALVACGSPAVPPATSTSPPVAPAAEVGIAEPASVELPGIGAASSLVPTGLNPDGTLEVPPVEQPLQASWWRDSPRPGQVGPAVILGHVDGGGKPGVFHRLSKVVQGDEVLIKADNGVLYRFVVYAVEQYGKNTLPTERVYGDTDGPELRLITCGGAFDYGSGHYQDNVVAFARLAGYDPVTE